MTSTFISAKKCIINFSIDQLKKRLAESDYKIIKCVECSLTEIALPYDIAALHLERQALRDRINALEAALSGLEAGTT